MTSHAMWIDTMIDTRPGFFPEVWELRNVSHLSSQADIYAYLKNHGLSNKTKKEIHAWIDFIDDDIHLIGLLPTAPITH